jgi:inosine-uridine nucleoside N-ribohydrolase
MTMQDMYVAFETRATTAGYEVGDPLGIWQQPANAHVILDIDRAAFVVLLRRGGGA